MNDDERLIQHLEIIINGLKNGWITEGYSVKKNNFNNKDGIHIDAVEYDIQIRIVPEIE